MAIEAVQVPDIAASATENGAISFVGKLDSAELLTGTPTVVELTSSDLTIASVAVSSSALTINGVSVAAGKAVTFSVTGQTAGTTYRLKATAGTDSTPAQSIPVIVSFRARDDSA